MLAVSFRNIKPRDEVRNRAEALYSKLERFLDPSAEGRMVVGVDHGTAIVELVVATHGQVHTASEQDDDLRTALDQLFHTMEGQLRRSKGRRSVRRSRDAEDADGFGTSQSSEE